MTSASPSGRRSAPGAKYQPWLKFAALVLAVAALGLPVNDLVRYGLLVIVTVVVVAGTIRAPLSETRRSTEDPVMTCPFFGDTMASCAVELSRAARP